MEASSDAENFVRAGLVALGIEADESDLAVGQAAHRLFAPGILELVSMDLSGVTPERPPDLSAPPPREKAP